MHLNSSCLPTFGVTLIVFNIKSFADKQKRSKNMSEVRDKFYKLLCYEIAGIGYQFKKSKGDFEKNESDLKKIIQFSWDGRGGITFLNGLNGVVAVPEIEKASKSILTYELPTRIFQPKSDDNKKYKQTQMYSQKLIELANGMKFKEMAAMPIEEKYPLERIQATVAVVADIIKYETVPFLNSYNDVSQISEYYILQAEKKYKLNDFHNISYWVFPIKLMCKKLKIEEPDFVKSINLFTNQSIDDLWNMQYHNFQNLEHRFNSLTFK